MISFVLAIVALILGYAFYSKFVEKVFGIEPDRTLLEQDQFSEPLQELYGDLLHFYGLFLDVFLEGQSMIS